MLHVLVTHYPKPDPPLFSKRITQWTHTMSNDCVVNALSGSAPSQLERWVGPLTRVHSPGEHTADKGYLLPSGFTPSAVQNITTHKVHVQRYSFTNSLLHTNTPFSFSITDYFQVQTGGFLYKSKMNKIRERLGIVPIWQ